MKTVIYYFSGTGNSLAVAKRLAENLEDVVELLPIAGCEKEQRVAIDADMLGLVFPVYFLTIPEIIRKFLKKLEFRTEPYIFTVVTCNSQPGYSLYSVKRILQKKGKSLALGFAVDMPGNGIIGKVDLTNPLEVQKERLANAPTKLLIVIQKIKERQYGVIEGGNSFKMHMLSFLMHFYKKYLYPPAKHFRVLNHCTRCGICVQVCPLKNIDKDVEHKPIWGERCESCLACFHWCPVQAINMEEDTVGKKRYHHPEISIEEMFLR